MGLHRLFVAFALCVGLLPRSVSADVTVPLKQTITQKEPVETSQTNTIEVSIRGQKRRTELLSLRYGHGCEERVGIFRIDDLSARKSTNVYPFLKGYEEEMFERLDQDMVERLALRNTPEEMERLLADKRLLDGLPLGSRMTYAGTGRTKTILEQPCHEVSFEVEFLKKRRLTGSMCISTGPGSSDYGAFARASLPLVKRVGDAVYDIGGDYFAVSHAEALSGGIPYELTYEEFDQSTGKMVSRTYVTVLKVSTARVRESAFEVPRGYRKCPSNACGQ